MSSAEPPSRAAGEELSCQELTELITAYIEDALPPPVRRRFEGHLAECPDCVNYLEQMRTTILLTRLLRPSDLEPAAKAALLAAFRGWKRG